MCCVCVDAGRCCLRFKFATERRSSRSAWRIRPSEFGFERCGSARGQCSDWNDIRSFGIVSTANIASLADSRTFICNTRKANCRFWPRSVGGVEPATDD